MRKENKYFSFTTKEDAETALRLMMYLWNSGIIKGKIEDPDDFNNIHYGLTHKEEGEPPNCLFIGLRG